MLSSTNKSHSKKVTIKILICTLVITLLVVGFIAVRLNGPGDEVAAHSGRRLAEITRPDTCEDRGCCFNRNFQFVRKFNCRELFTVKDCVAASRLCVWQCDRRRLAKAQLARFVNFDDGTGENDEFAKEQQKDDGIIPEFTEKETVADAIARLMYWGTYWEWSECGDQYEYQLTKDEAISILKDPRLQRVTMGSARSDQMINYPDEKTKDSDLDISKGDRRRNLLTVWLPDGRSQSFSLNQYPRNVIGILVTDSGSWCTGTLVSRRVVLTAAHCLYDTGTNSWTGGWTFYPDTRSDTTFGGTSGIGYRWSRARVTKRWVDQTKSGIPSTYDTWSSSRDCDYGMVVLRDTPGGWMSFGYDNTLPSDTFNTYGYPGDQPNGTRWFQYCEHGQLFSQQTRSRQADSPDCDVAGGQSGSPNYLYWSGANRRIIYALTSGQTSTYNVYSRIDKTKFNFICSSILDLTGQNVCP